MNRTTTHGPLRIFITWLALALIATLAVVAVELGAGGAQSSPLQPAPAQAKSAPSPPDHVGRLLLVEDRLV